MKPLSRQIVLAMDLRPLSFGFAVFEGPDELLDWGIKNFRHGINAAKVPMDVKLAMLLDQYTPNVLVISKPKTSALNGMVRAALAQDRRISVRLISRTAVRNAFPGNNHNKHQIATAIAAHFPELSPRLGHQRKLWEAEPYSAKLFDAAALGVAFFMHNSTEAKTNHRAIWSVPR
jgi:hypothetical protein